MNNFLTEDTKAIFLLCGVLGKSTSSSESGQVLKPLSTGEYNTLVQWLIKMDLRPKDLLHGDIYSKASIATHIQEQRLEKLLSRGVQLGFAIEQWQRHGIWLISRSDTDYPARYKEHLNEQAPPLLFGVGNRSLLQGGGLAIVGSRNADERGYQFTQDVAQLCAQNALPVVSGYAKGVDQLAMHTALNAGGTAIGIVAENLLQKSLELATRTALAAQSLLLLSPYNPETPFTPWAAMARNKLIYAMADYGLVVSAEYPKSGTWSGAHEELKRSKALPVFVRSEEHTPQGNEKLLELGAKAWPEIDATQALVEQLQKAIKHDASLHMQNSLLSSHIQEPSIAEITEAPTSKPHEEEQGRATPKEISAAEHAEITIIFTDEATALYDMFIKILQEKIEGPLTAEEIAAKFVVGKAQVQRWLKKAVQEKKIKKLTKPVRYEKALAPPVQRNSLL